MKHMSPAQTCEFRKQLLAREQQLSLEIAAVLARQQSSEREGRALDAGVLDLETGLNFAEVARDQLELDAVHAALGRIDRGTFARCLSCGACIPLERLKVQPEAALCHVCQSRAESNQGRRFVAP